MRYETLLKSVPNAVTSCNLFFGFLSLLATMQGEYASAMLFIVCAAGADAIDGVAARVLNAQSDLGKELDSLADLVSFGVAPSLLIYQHYLKDIGLLGVLVCFIPMLCAALRLARFNVGIHDQFFKGLSAPVSATWIVGLMMILVDIPNDWRIQVVLCMALGLSSLLMISRLPYPRTIRLNRVYIVIGLGSLFVPKAILLIGSSLYISTGLMRYGVTFLRKLRNDGSAKTYLLSDMNAECAVQRQKQVNA
jgi:CDP-diacylglycerol---serine O-phosphatidyltransferase